MVLIQDNRPRDWAYKAVFKEKDLPSLEAMAKHIRETHDIDMIEDFNAKCEQKLAGEKTTFNGLELQEVTKTGDLVTNPGLDQCIRIIQGTSVSRWSNFGFSIGNIPPTVTDTTLQDEDAGTRAVFAWSEAVGMRLYFGGISSQTEGTAPIVAQEIGIFNQATLGGIMLNRSVFTADTIGQAGAGFTNPTIYTAPLVVSSVIQFCPVA